MRDVGLVRRIQPPDAARRKVEDGVVPGVPVAGQEPPAALDLRQDRSLGLVPLQLAAPTNPPRSSSQTAPSGARASAGWKSKGFCEGLSTNPTYQRPSILVMPGSPAALVGRQRRPLRLEDVHAAEDVIGGGQVTHVQAFEVEVAPRLVGHDRLVPLLVADDLARVVAQQETVAQEVGLG